MDTIIVAVVTIVAVLSSLYLFALSQVAFLKKNWAEYRCNPIYMPMAGLVGQDVMSNFTKCTMKGFHDYAGFIMDPLMAEFSIVNDTLEEVGGAVHSMRGMMSGVRGGFLGIIGTVFGKIENLMSQFQYIIIRMRTLMSRVVGIMASFLYVFYAGAETGGSIMNGPIMKTMSFLCFHPDTLVMTEKGYLPLKNVQLGDLLKDGGVVTSKYLIDGNRVHMYMVGRDIVSGEHKIRYENKFIPVKEYPFARRVPEIEHLMCLNTSTNRIFTSSNEYLDFDEITTEDFLSIKRIFTEVEYNKTFNENNKYTVPKSGVVPGTLISTKKGPKPVESILPKDILDNGDTIIGIVMHNLPDKLYSLLGSSIIMSPSTWILNDNKVHTAYANGANALLPKDGYYQVFQLITESSTFPVIDNKGNRFMLLDEIELRDPYFYKLKNNYIKSM
jgi:hypothetical protein